MLYKHIYCMTDILWTNRSIVIRRCISKLTPQKISRILATNEVHLNKSRLVPAFIKAVECNQLASNNPIEDRLRVSAIHYPDLSEPTLMLGVFDGHGGGTNADIICRRLFNYIALAIHPNPKNLEISNRLNGSLIDLHSSPSLNNDPRLQTIETEMFRDFRDDIVASWQDKQIEVLSDVIPARLKASFQRCDDDLSNEIQAALINHGDTSEEAMLYYSYAAVSGCCAIVMVIHQGFAYIASSGDCRAALGLFDLKRQTITEAIDLNVEHNCDNINEIRRLAASHPRSEQNTMIKHNRLLGHLMPFRAFGDFQYKWKPETIKACGLTRIFQSFPIIPEHYKTPPYLITEPDIKVIKFEGDKLSLCGEKIDHTTSNNREKYIVMASDGLWELFESSRDVIETLIDHAINANLEGKENDYDANGATYLLRSALCCGPHQDIGMDQERLRQLYHVRLESTLTLPKAEARNYRDDISIILLKV